jgi:hypothetical protein
MRIGESRIAMESTAMSTTTPPTAPCTEKIMLSESELIDPRDYAGADPLPVPYWAEVLIHAMAEVGRVSVPTIEWYEARTHIAGGWYNYKDHSITIIASSYKMDNMLTIAHEMAHAIAGLGHSVEMYSKFIELVELFGLNQRLAIKQEIEYQPVPFLKALSKRIEDEKYRTDYR